MSAADERRFNTQQLGFVLDVPRHLTLTSYSNPRSVVAVWLGLVALSAVAAVEIRFETSISSFLDTQSTTWSDYQRSIEKHGGDEFISIASSHERSLSPELLAWIEATTRRLEEIDGVERVDGLASTALIRSAEEAGVSLKPATKSFPGDQDPTREQLATALRKDLIAPAAYISPDHRTASLNVVLDDRVEGDRLAVVTAVRSAIGTEAHMSGVPVFRTAINADTQRETFLFVPLVTGAIALVLTLSFRRSAAVLLPLATGGVGSTVVVAALSLSGTPLSLSTMILPSILLALGCAYALHPIAAWASATYRDDPSALIASTSGAVALSGITTALGFISLAGSPLETIRSLAIFGSIGVTAITAASLTLVPAALAISPSSEDAEEPAVASWIRHSLASKLSKLAYRKPGEILLLWGVATVVAAIGLTKLEVSTDIVAWYPEDSEIRRDYEIIRESMSGITPVSLFIEANGEDHVTAPRVIEAIDRLSAELESNSEVGKVLSIAHPLRLMKRAYSPDSSGLPESEAETRQYLLLLEGEEAVWDVISRDLTSSRVAMRLNDNSSEAIQRIATHGQDWWTANGPADFKISPTGIMYQFAEANRSIVQTQVGGLLLAFLGMTVVLVLVLRSPVAAFGALFPNLLPLALAYGGMGLAGIPLDSGTACLGSLALGIAVDDTVHIATNWSERRSTRRGSYRAMREALGRVMPALTVSTVCIALGFAALTLSGLGLVRNLGMMTATVVVVCWLADVTLLPVLLRQYQPSDSDV